MDASKVPSQGGFVAGLEDPDAILAQNQDVHQQLLESEADRHSSTLGGEKGGDGEIAVGSRKKGASGTGSQMMKEMLNNRESVIDLESENLTYFQAKAIRKQVQKDCELLRNRVRMLRQEMDRSRKKIEETRKKTSDIMELKLQNDLRYQEKLLLEKEREESGGPTTLKMEERLKVTEDIKQKRFHIFAEKKREVEQYKQEYARNKQFLASYRHQYQKQNFERKLKVKQDLALGHQKKAQFLEQKRRQAQRETDTIMEKNRNEIQVFEQEAETLEQVEAELLKKLQETQKKERDVFVKLETAMIDASIPKKQRVVSLVGNSLASINQPSVNSNRQHMVVSEVEEASAIENLSSNRQGQPRYDPFDTYAPAALLKSASKKK